MLPTVVEAAYLTAALQRCGALGDGRVAAVEAEAPRDQLVSRIVRLRSPMTARPTQHRAR